MAKKKTESTESTSAAEDKSPAKKAPAKKAAAPKAAAATKAAAPKVAAKPAAAHDLPSINTNAAAAAAAAMIGNRVSIGGGGVKPESAAFKAMKENLHKPSGRSAAGNLLGNLGGHQKSNQPNAFGKQVGKNQTFGADVNRAGVPRRTGG